MNIEQSASGRLEGRVLQSGSNTTAEKVATKWWWHWPVAIIVKGADAKSFESFEKLLQKSCSAENNEMVALNGTALPKLTLLCEQSIIKTRSLNFYILDL